jgi:hypothetical protein
MKGEPDGWPWKRLSPIDDEPTPVLVNGEVHYRCSVCERTVVSTRAQLDSSGRCDDCRP